MGPGPRYELIKEGDDIKDEAQPTIISPPVTSSWWKFLLCNFVAACVGAGLMSLIARGVFAPHPSTSTSTSTVASVATSTASAIGHTHPSSSVEHLEQDSNKQTLLPGQILDCGYNPKTAREKGCVYDVMMQDWVPEPCYDSVLTEKYLAEGNWTWYGDGDGKTTIPLEIMRKGEHGHAWMATSYHKAHCVFSWLKIIRALRNNAGISQELLSYDHVLHCSHGALKAKPNDEGLGVKAPTNYAKCALYDTWILDLIPDKHNSTQRR